MSARLEALRRIVAEHQAAKVEGVVVDVQTANAILKVYGAVNEANQEKLLSVSVTKMGLIAWAVVT